MNKQRVALLILAIILLLSLVYSYFRMPKQQQVAKLTHAPGVTATSVRSKGVGEPKVVAGGAKVDAPLALSLLDQPEGQFKGFRRNLFKPIFREDVKIAPLPPPPPAPPQKSILPSKAPVQPPPVSPPVTTPVEAAKQEMGRLRFLGFLRKDAVKTIFLAEGSQIFLVRKGDMISSRYQVTGLTDDAITITVLADKSDLVFPLMENRALSASSR